MLHLFWHDVQHPPATLKILRFSNKDLEGIIQRFYIVSAVYWVPSQLIPNFSDNIQSSSLLFISQTENSINKCQCHFCSKKKILRKVSYIELNVFFNKNALEDFFGSASKQIIRNDDNTKVKHNYNRGLQMSIRLQIRKSVAES